MEVDGKWPRKEDDVLLQTGGELHFHVACVRRRLNQYLLIDWLEDSIQDSVPITHSA